MNEIIYDKRILAHVVLEAVTPLVISSGNKSVLTDSPILKDLNGFPYIPGTSMAGILRHCVGEDKAKGFFGMKDGKTVKGSRIIISEAKMVGLDGTVLDGIVDLDTLDKDWISRFVRLPKRNHVRISDKGTAEDKGKFDEEVIYKGTRFAFDVELVASMDDEAKYFDETLSELLKETFRIGGGSRSGFGKVKVVSLLKKEFDLRKADELDGYLKCSSSLCSDYSGWTEVAGGNVSDAGWIKYDITLTPEDFFLFGAGFGDDEVDDKAVTESYINWGDKSVKGKFIDNAILIPAASLKGALSHRVAFHYNAQHNKVYAIETDPNDFGKHCGSQNPAVKELFGYQDDDSETSQKRGICLFEDVIGKYETAEKVLNHVSIDRFTGGAIDGALFSEKVIDRKALKSESKTKSEVEDSLASDVVDGKDRNLEFKTSILVKKPSGKSEDFDKALDCLELALKDIDRGTLPLGGGSGRGHGIFKCKWTKTE